MDACVSALNQFTDFHTSYYEHYIVAGKLLLLTLTIFLDAISTVRLITLQLY